MDREFWIDLCGRVLGAVGGLDELRWRRAVERIVSDLAAYASVTHDIDLYLVGTADQPSLRELLLWTHVTMRGTPAELLQDFKPLEERELDEAERWTARAFFQLGTPPADHREILVELGGALRAMDGFLASVSLGDAPEVDELGRKARRYEMPSYGFYIVPADRHHRAGVDKPFIRRALKCHSILPTRIGNNSVSLHYHDAVLPGGPDAWQSLRYGAALFPCLELEIWNEGKLFRVDRVVSDEQDVRIGEHLEAAHASECDVLLWPELTLDWETIERIEKSVKSAAHRDRKNMKIILAGSAHVYDAVAPAGFRNRTRILDGRGRRLVDYDKRMKFSFPSRLLDDGRPDPTAPRLTEAIEPGKDLPIIILEDRLVAVAICLDFCEKTGGLLPYHLLDVDLVLVPSMGYLNTTQLHLEQAHTMDVEYDTTVFVVQQIPVLAGAGGRVAGQPAGYSLVSPVSTGTDHSQNEAFRVYGG